MRSLALLAIALGLVGAASAVAAAAPPDARRIMLVIDISSSMDEDDGAGTRKIDGAKLALLDYVGSVEGDTQIGLRTYPEPSGVSCNPGRMLFAPATVDPEEMSATIRRLQPNGDTPTAEAMLAAAEDLGAGGGMLVIVSDGESNCGDPCDAARTIRDRGTDIQTITVGFRISDAGQEELQCISDALDGRYLDIEESDELRDALDRLGRPRIEVELDGPADPVAIAGGDEIEIAATVTNTGEVEATDVIGQLTFRTQGADVRRPVARLGNLAPHAAQQVVWRVRAAPGALDPDARASIPFVVVGRALNASRTGVARGTLRAVGVPDAAHAGEILKGPGRGIAILGDSYSAGEGADVYDPATDTSRNGCHRSPLTYLSEMPSFRKDVDVLACAGAVTANVTGRFDDNGERAQTERLLELQDEQGPVKAVVMTAGGNDVDFGALAKGCVLAFHSCHSEVYTGLPLNPFPHTPANAFYEQHLGEQRLRGGWELDDWLRTTYEQVDLALNHPVFVRKRAGRVAPILVLGYPLPVPLQGRTCSPMGAYRVSLSAAGRTAERIVYLLTAQEIDYVVRFGVRLNAVIESVVRTLHADRGIPIFYVPTTERAFQPNHTVCDARERFARSVTSLNGAGVNERTIVDLANPSPLGVGRRLRANLAAVTLALKELVHPNAAGYRAESQAILRWTRSRQAEAAAAFTRGASAPEAAPTSWNVEDVDLGQLQPGAVPTLQGGASYPLTLDGFAPAAEVRIEVHSDPRPLGTVAADANGRVETLVPLPSELADGRHTLVVAGVDPQGKPRTVRIPFKLDRPFRPTVFASMAALSGTSLLLGISSIALTGRASRRRRRRQGSTVDDQ